MRSLVSTAVALAALGAPSASVAANRIVDDNRAECPFATYSTIQSAINAAAPGDVVRVCKGNYAEELVLPHDKPGLVVKSTPAREAHVFAPPGGLTPYRPMPSFSDYRYNLVRVNGDGQYFNDFTLHGPLMRPGEACNQNQAIEVGARNPVIDGNRIALPTAPAPTCRPQGGVAKRSGGIFVDGDGTRIDRNLVEGAGVAIFSDQGARNLVIQRNTIVGQGVRSGSRGVVMDFVGGLRIASNPIAATSTAIQLGVVSGGVVVIANTIAGNQDGIVTFDGTVADIRENTVRNNTRDGIVMTGIRSMGAGTAGLIRRNSVRDNGRDGIQIGGCGASCKPGNNVWEMTDNVSLGNARFDCSGLPGPDQIWRGNTGRKSSAPGLCRPPA